MAEKPGWSASISIPRQRNASGIGGSAAIFQNQHAQAQAAVNAVDFVFNKTLACGRSSPLLIKP